VRGPTRFLPIAALLAIACVPSLIPNPPGPPPTEVFPPTPVSVVQVPIAVSVEDLRKAIDSVVPKESHIDRYNAQIDNGADNCGHGVSYGYYLNRSAMSFGQEPDGRFSLATNLDYGVGAQARRTIACILFRGNCGYDGEAARQAWVKLFAKPEVDTFWALKLNAGNADAGAGANRCTVTLLNIDVTDRVLNAAKDFLNGQTGALNAKVAADTRLRDALAKAWLAAWTPIDLGKGAWLVVQPKTAGIESFSPGQDSLRAAVRLVAEPVVVLGPKPAPTPTGLANNTSVKGDDSLRIQMPIRGDYTAIKSEMKSVLHIGSGGNRYPAVGKVYIKPTDIDVSGNGNQLIVRLAFEGSANGVLYLVGTPKFDQSTQTLTVPDLDYTLETKNILLKLANWVAGSQLRDDLRAKLVVNLAPQMQAAKDTLVAALNRQVGPLRLVGTVSTVGLQRINVNDVKRSVDAVALLTGSLSASVKP
jgi:Domain of unknown function (DUF4403)